MPSQYSNLEKIRQEKLERLRGQSIEPYPARSERTHTSQEAIQAFEQAEAALDPQPVHATLVGRIRSIRPMGKITFAHIEDGYTAQPGEIGYELQAQHTRLAFRA